MKNFKQNHQPGILKTGILRNPPIWRAWDNNCTGCRHWRANRINKGFPQPGQCWHGGKFHGHCGNGGVCDNFQALPDQAAANAQHLAWAKKLA